jgi:hypothetical protein
VLSTRIVITIEITSLRWGSHVEVAVVVPAFDGLRSDID